jgi:hypothetical protein
MSFGPSVSDANSSRIRSRQNVQVKRILALPYGPRQESSHEESFLIEIPRIGFLFLYRT